MKLNSELQQQLKEKEGLQKKMVELREKIKIKDLYRDDPYTFTHLIEEIRNLRQQITAADTSTSKLIQGITFLKNKHGGVDVDKKMEQFKLSADDQRTRLAQLLEDIEILKELFEDFDGYTSDTQEEDFIERLGVDLRELANKHTYANEESEQTIDAISAALKNI